MTWTCVHVANNDVLFTASPSAADAAAVTIVLIIIGICFVFLATSANDVTFLPLCVRPSVGRKTQKTVQEFLRNFWTVGYVTIATADGDADHGSRC